MPFFGVPLRNGLPLGLGSTASLSSGVGFSPSELFAGGQAGAWYDPSDSTTLFSDTAGTTPVAEPGAGALVNVGLMLDKSQNGVGTNGAKRLNLLTYSEEFNNAAWAKNGSGVTQNTIVAPNGSLTADTFIADATGPAQHNLQQGPITAFAASYTFSTSVKYNNNRWVAVALYDSAWRVAAFDVQNGVVGTSISAGVTASIINQGNGWYRCQVTYTTVTAAVYGGIFLLPSDTTSLQWTTTGIEAAYIWGADLRLTSEASTAPTYQPITSSWYATEVGNHAISYNSTTARPELSARVNLLTYSEQFDNAAWFKNNITVSANAAVAPDGTTTADKVIPTAANVTHSTFNTPAASTTSGVVYAASVYVKASEYNFVAIVNNTIASYNASVCIDLTTGAQSNAGASGTYLVTSVGNGWWRVTVTATATSTSGYLEVHPRATAGPANSAFLGDGTSGVLVWGAQLIATNAFPANTYQRIAGQYTYDNGPSFPRYLRFDGVDDGMSTPANLNLTSTDKMTVFAGVRKLSDAANGVIGELSAAYASNTGAFVIRTGSSATTVGYLFASRGTLNLGTYADVTTPVSPVTNVATGIGDIAGDSQILRLNGVQVASSTIDQGTGNYGTYPLYVGSRGNASTWFNGHLYSLIVRGAATDASTISATETWVAGKTGISIFDDGPSLGLDFTAQTYQVWEV